MGRPRRTLTGVRQPRQERSRKTRERILAAVEALLEEKSFDELTVGEIVARAGSSVGAFYGRFADKEELLQALDERYFDLFVGRVEGLLDPARWEGKGIEAIVEAVLAELVAMHVQHRGFIRTLVLRARVRSDARFRAREQRTWELLPRLEALLLARRSQIAHPDPKLAAVFGFLLVFFAMREMVLYDHLAKAVPVHGEALVAELTRAFTSYLGTVDATRQAPPQSRARKRGSR